MAKKTPRTTGDRWKRLKGGISAVQWKFLLFQLVLPVSDIVTDILTGKNYHGQGHLYWAWSIWLLMLGPLMLAISSEVLQYLGRCIKKDATTSDNTDTILKFLGLVPIFQPFVHSYFAYKLQEAQKKMIEAEGEYKKVEVKVSRGVTHEQMEDLRMKVKSAAIKYVDNKKKYFKLVTIFQGIRLYEIIGESGPQAALQLSIFLRVGYINWIQVFGIVTRELPYIKSTTFWIFLLPLPLYKSMDCFVHKTGVFLNPPLQKVQVLYMESSSAYWPSHSELQKLSCCIIPSAMMSRKILGGTPC